MKKILSIALCLILCLSAMALTVSAETCEGQETGHTPTTSWWAADNDYACLGGHDVDYSHCEVCGIECDASGNVVPFVEPTAEHELTSLQEADFTECGGGHKVDYYACEVCWHTFDAEGNLVYYEDGNGAHTLGEQKEANYTECGGGYTEAYATCTVCGDDVNADGEWPDYEEPAEDAKHTPGELLWEADFTECGGGYTEDIYECSVCGCETNEEGIEPEYKEGTDVHTPGSTLYDAYYTPCCGGIKVDYYECTACQWPVDAEGKPVEYYAATEKHTPGEKMESNYTECGGGHKEDFYLCTVCASACTEEGEFAEWSEPTTDGHTISLQPQIDPTYTEYGFKEHWACDVCGYIFANEAGDDLTMEEYEALIIPKLVPGNPDVPATADNTTMGLYMVLALASIAAVAVISTKAKRA